MANRFKAWIEQSGMTQRQVASKLGITQGYVAALASEDPPWPSRVVMQKMIRLTGLSAEALTGIGRTVPVRRKGRVIRKIPAEETSS